MLPSSVAVGGEAVGFSWSGSEVVFTMPGTANVGGLSVEVTWQDRPERSSFVFVVFATPAVYSVHPDNLAVGVVTVVDVYGLGYGGGYTSSCWLDGQVFAGEVLSAEHMRCAVLRSTVGAFVLHVGGEERVYSGGGWSLHQRECCGECGAP